MNKNLFPNSRAGSFSQMRFRALVDEVNACKIPNDLFPLWWNATTANLAHAWEEVYHFEPVCAEQAVYSNGAAMAFKLSGVLI